MQFHVVCLFPELVRALFSCGMQARGVKLGLLSLTCWNPRDYAKDAHRTVDDRPYGGGPGMVMKYDPLAQAIQHARAATDGRARVIYLSPQGRRFDQDLASDLAGSQTLILVCGRYEGVDERLIAAEVDEELSIGDYVLSGGELAAMVVMDAVSRLIPGVLGDEQSAAQDSFGHGLLDHPHYTRPEMLPVGQVPEVLLSGDHERIRRWRLKQSLGRTWLRRPDLLNAHVLDDEQQQLLNEFMREYADKGS